MKKFLLHIGVSSAIVIGISLLVCFPSFKKVYAHKLFISKTHLKISGSVLCLSYFWNVNAYFFFFFSFLARYLLAGNVTNYGLKIEILRKNLLGFVIQNF